MKRLALLILLLASPAPAAMSEKAETAAICDAAALRGAETGDAPADILRALTRTETGRKLEGKLRPWPWTVNMEGEGFWFDTREEALAFVRKRHDAGAVSFDVGCFQVNFRWHGEAFDSIADMFDPVLNARYAAHFLSELKREGGDWRAAVGRYHSRTPKYANRYKKRFETILANLGAAPDIRLADTPVKTPKIRGSWPPLFSAGANGGKGGVFVAAPAHGDPGITRADGRGGVALSAFSNGGGGLLRKSRPLFD